MALYLILSSPCASYMCVRTFSTLYLLRERERDIALDFEALNSSKSANAAVYVASYSSLHRGRKTRVYQNEKRRERERNRGSLSFYTIFNKALTTSLD